MTFIDAINNVITDTDKKWKEEFIKEDNGKTPPRIFDYFEDDFFDNITGYIEFLNEISDEHIYKEANNFITICFQFINSEFNHKFDKLNSINTNDKNTREAPTREIEKDLKIIRKFKSLLESKKNIIKDVHYTDKDKTSIAFGTTAISLSKDFKTIHAFVTKIEQELETKEFNIVNRNRYYMREKYILKKDIDEFLLSLVKQYSIKGGKQHIEPLSSKIQSPD